MSSIISSTLRTRSLSTLSQRRRNTYDEVESTKTMLDRTEQRLGLKPKRLAHFARLPLSPLIGGFFLNVLDAAACQAAAVLRSLHGRHSHPRADSLATARAVKVVN